MSGQFTKTRGRATSTSANTPVAGAEQLEALVREALAAGRPALPRSVRRELARLLLDGGRDRAVGGHTARHAGEGSA
jgi:alpha-beta hydrolase superfamily lysophospholipase